MHVWLPPHLMALCSRSSVSAMMRCWWTKLTVTQELTHSFTLSTVSNRCLSCEINTGGVIVLPAVVSSASHDHHRCGSYISTTRRPSSSVSLSRQHFLTASHLIPTVFALRVGNAVRPWGSSTSVSEKFVNTFLWLTLWWTEFVVPPEGFTAVRA